MGVVRWFVNSFSTDPHIPHPGQTSMGSPKHPFFRGRQRYSQGPPYRVARCCCVVGRAPTHGHTTFTVAPAVVKQKGWKTAHPHRKLVANDPKATLKMTSCVITDKRSRRTREFLLPKSFFPARVAKLGKTHPSVRGKLLELLDVAGRRCALNRKSIQWYLEARLKAFRSTSAKQDRLAREKQQRCLSATKCWAKFDEH